MATLPPKVPVCERCKTANIKVVDKIVGEGIYRRTQHQLTCTNCNHVQGLLH